MTESVSEKLLKRYEKMFEMELEFIRLIEEKKKEVRPGMFGKGKAEDFFKAKLEVYGQ